MKIKERTILTLTLVFSIVFLPLSSANINLQQTASEQLVIYTYDSLLADPGYDYIGNFSSTVGIPRESIKVVAFSDAAEILTRAALEKDNPVADVLIGIDNALVHKARTENILIPYKPNGSESLVNGLVEGLASDYLLTPYDYGVISLFYDKTRISFNESFSLQSLIDLGLGSKLIIENPLLSSPGLGFLLWSLAEFGHSTLGGSDDGWREFWTELTKEVRIVDSWGDAFNEFFTPEAGRPIMVSYTSSPAYGNCLYGDNSTGALLTTTSDGKLKGWEQIEGIGLVNNAPHESLAKKFIDWFISPQLQEQIYLNQWMYPANANIDLPSCYENVTYAPSEIEPYNKIISQDKISTYLNDWYDEWESVIASTNKDSPISLFSVLSGMIMLPVILRRKIKGAD